MGSEEIYWKRSHRARLTRDLIRAELLSGRWSGTKLPSETELSQRYDASRNTIREALSLLVEEKMVERIHGYGTVSKARIVEYEVNRLQSLSEQASITPVDHVTLTWSQTRAPAAVAEALGVAEHAMVMLWERITRNPKPMIFWSSYLNPRFRYSVPSREQGTYSFFEHNDQDVAFADFRTGAMAADESVAQFLDIVPGSPILYQTRLLHRRDGVPLEVCTGYYRADRIVLTSSQFRPAPSAARTPGTRDASKFVEDPAKEKVAD